MKRIDNTNVESKDIEYKLQWSAKRRTRAQSLQIQ